MDIVVASDDNYAPHLATLVCSICENNRDTEIVIHILDNGISIESKAKIFSMTKQYTHLSFKEYKISDEYISEKTGCNLSADRSLAAYARIFIPLLLPETVQIALYMDVDAIVLGKLAPMLDEIDHSFCIAGVKDVNPAARRTAVFLEKQDTYINSGMIMWDMNLCRKKNIVQRFVEFIKKNNGIVDAMDQGTINGALRGDIKVLHPKWNVMTPFFQKDAEELSMMAGWDEYYTQKQLDEAVNNPIYVHFTPNMTTRPWTKHCKHPLRKDYIKYRNMTKFKIVTLEKDKRNILTRFIGWLYRNLPYKIFRKMSER